MGGQADRLVGIIQENDQLQSKIRKNLESQVVQTVLGLALQNDRDEDFSFNNQELRRLKTSLSNIPGINFDKNNFDKTLGRKDALKLSDIMSMLRNLKADIPEEDNIFHLAPEKLARRGLFG